MKAAILIVALSLTVSCGGSPTSPTSTTTTSVAPVVAEQPAPPPAPLEPVPEPVPAPEPPAPPAPTVYAAETASAHWYGKKLLPSRFQVQMFNSSVQFGPIRVTIAQKSSDSVILVDRDYTISLVRQGSRWTWTFNGLAGQATGIMK